MHPRILITGGSGLLALNWAAAMRGRYNVTLGLHERGVSLAGVATSCVDLESVDSVLTDFERLEPQVVIHAAGLTNVEKCETYEGLARHVNVVLAENVAKACAALGLTLVHISTDHLFAGEAALVSEDQATQPKNAYGRTKAEAEVRVLEALPDALVVRTNFYGWGPSYRHSFSDVIITKLLSGQGLSLFQDVYYTPIIATELASVVHDLLDLKVAGICNVVGDERLSKYEFGQRLCKVFNLDASLISPSRIGQHPSLTRRPLDMSLSNDKVSKLLGRSVGGVNQHLPMLKEQEKNGLAKELRCI